MKGGGKMIRKKKLWVFRLRSDKYNRDDFYVLWDRKKELASGDKSKIAKKIIEIRSKPTSIKIKTVAPFNIWLSEQTRVVPYQCFDLTSEEETQLFKMLQN